MHGTKSILCSVAGCAVAAWLGVLAQPASAVVTIDWVSVGNPGNPADPGTGSLYGSVGYEYQIAAYEVTLGQYAEFLNSVAASDPYDLYNPAMATDLNTAGISRSGSSGSYNYTVIGGSPDRPVTYVSWFDAARFANWMHNGQGSGDTETGAYNLSGAISGIFTREADAAMWIPTEDEWYKAAYYDPTAGAGGGDNYWLYPTQSDSVPGNELDGSPNQANFRAGDFATTPGNNTYSATQPYLTDAGAFVNSPSYYGTFDQAGNVYEWNDAIIGSSRGWRGGAWGRLAATLRASDSKSAVPTIEAVDLGFRLAAVPEPSIGLLAGLAGALAIARRRRAAA